jgi:patatin-like phospholipase/acyl hydrolase
MEKVLRILSCDGGGIRGLLTAKLLEELEKELQQLRPSSSLVDFFDLFAGTSTGSIIACGLAKGMSAQAISQFYENEGGKIFPKMDPIFWAEEVIERVKRGHFSLPLFKPDSLEEVLSSDNIFPDELLLEDLVKPVLVMSYDSYNRKAVAFKSTDAKSRKVPVWQVCRASSAAPVAFPGYLLKNNQFCAEHLQGGGIEGDLPREIPPEGVPLIDGGILANNPTLCAIAEAYGNDAPLENILVASFGTGQQMRRITPDEATSWGAFVWSDLLKGIPLYQICSDGSADVIDYIAKSLLKENYLRFQPVIDSRISTFQADEHNLDLLRDAAKDYLEKDGSNRLKDLANTLVRT